MAEEGDFAFSNDTNITSDLWEISFRIDLVGTLIFTVISFVGVVANGIVVYKVARHKHLQTKNNFFIANLAGADTVLFLALIIPRDVNFFTEFEVFTTWKSLAIAQYIQHVCIQATALILVFMSFSRYTMAAFPLKARAEWTTLRVWMCCAASWLVSVIIYIPILFGVLIASPEGYNRVESKIFAVATMFLLFILPFVFIVFCYAGIIINFRKDHHMVRENSNIDPGVRVYQSRKLTRMVLIIICVFFVSWAPIQSYLTWLTCREHTRPTSPANWRHIVILGFCARLTAYLGGAINPFIYAYTNPSFKNSKIFRLGKGSQSSMKTESYRSCRYETGSRKAASGNSSDKAGEHVTAV